MRSYAGRSVSEGDPRELLEAARNAPSSLNSQPWRFKVVTGRADIAWLGTKDATRKQDWPATAMNVGIALSFMMLRPVGLGECRGGMFNEEAIKTRFGIDPTLRMVTLMAAGHPAEAEVYPRRRKTLGDIVLP